MKMAVNTPVLTALVFLATIHHLHFASTATVSKKYDDLPMSYPEPINDELQSKFDTPEEVPEPCKHLTYCTMRPSNYPDAKFKEWFKDYKPAPQPQLIKEIQFENRQGDPSEVDNCESEVTFEPLYKARDKRDNAWRTVVQAPELGVVQRVRLETCKNPDAKCFTAFLGTPEYVTFCKQKYNTWKVLVASGDNSTELIETTLPVCCSCHYKPVTFASRFGLTKDKN